jgi:hypothetical protein
LAVERLETRNLLSFVWNIVPSPNPPESVNSPLNGVVAAAENDVWAVGLSELPSGPGTVYQTLTEHWNGTGWSIIPSPNVAGRSSLLDGVSALGASAVASDDVWAVGHAFNPNGTVGAVGQTLTEHWNGTGWSIVPSPIGNPNTVDSELLGVVAISANDVWAVGYQKDSFGQRLTLTEHWDGTQWNLVVSPSVDANYNTLYSVTASGSNDVWAVGSSGQHGSTLIEHWDGTGWHVVPSPSGGYDGALYSVTAVSPTDVWAVGTGNLQTLTEHWDGLGWTVVPSPSPGTNTFLTGVTARGRNDLWAVGNGNGTATGFNGPFTEHWDGTSWAIVGSPSVPGGTTLNAVAAVPFGTVWSVGLGNHQTFTMNLRENGPATHLNFIVPTTITAGTPFTITVQALDAMNQVDTGYTDTVHFTASNGAQANYTFTTSDHGQHTFHVTLYQAQTLTVTGADIANPLIHGSITFTVNPAAAAHIVFTIPDTVTAGVPFDITVTVQDAYGNTVTDFGDTVQFVASNGVTADYTFTPADMGQHTFHNLVINQPGTITITGTDLEDPSVTGSITFTVNSSQ